MFVSLTRSLLSGLMWFVYDGQFNIRHTCEHGDHLQRYGWIRHDGTSFGQQEIIDNGERIDIHVILFSKFNSAIFEHFELFYIPFLPSEY